MSDVAELGLRADSREVRRATDDLRSMTGAAGKAESATQRVTREMDQQMMAISRLSGGIRNLATGFAAGFGIAGVSAAISSAVGAIGDFEVKMNAVRAVTDASDADFKRLQASARELGATTRYSAGEAAEGMEALGSAGFSTSKIIAAMPTVLNLATAAQLSLAEAAEITASTIAQFQLRAEDSVDVGNVMAAVANKTNAGVRSIGEAMKYVGPVAQAMNISLRDTSALIGILSNNAIKGSQAGTALRTILSDLAKPSELAKDSLAAIGVSLDQVNPQTVSFTQILKTLKDANLDAASAFKIFGAEGAPAILALTSSIPQLEQLSGELGNVDGALQKMADLMAKGLRNDMAEASSAFEELSLRIGTSGLTAGISGLVQLFTALLKVMQQFAPEIVTGGFLAIAAVAGRVTAAVTGAAGAHVRAALTTRAHNVELAQNAVLEAAAATAALNEARALEATTLAAFNARAVVNGLTVSTVELTAAQNATAVAATRSAAATAAATAATAGLTIGARVAAGAMGLLRGAMALLGGPIGVLVTAGAGLYYWLTRNKGATEKVGDAASDAAAKLKDLVAQKRAAAGLPPVVSDEELAGIATYQRQVNELASEIKVLSEARAVAEAAGDVAGAASLDKGIADKLAKIQELADEMRLLAGTATDAAAATGAVNPPLKTLGETTEDLAKKIAEANKSAAEQLAALKLTNAMILAGVDADEAALRAKNQLAGINPALTQQIIDQTRVEKARKEAIDEVTASLKRQQEAIDSIKGASGQYDTLSDLKDQLALMQQGVTAEEAAYQVKLKRLALDSGFGDDAAVDIERYQRAIKELGAEHDAVADAAKKSAQSQIEAYERAAGRIEDTVDDVYNAALRGFDEFSDQIKESLRNLLAEMALQATKNAILIPIQTAILGQAPGATGGVGSLLSGASSLGGTAGLFGSSAAPAAATGASYTGVMGSYSFASTGAAPAATGGLGATLSAIAGPAVAAYVGFELGTALGNAIVGKWKTKSQEVGLSISGELGSSVVDATITTIRKQNRAVGGDRSRTLTNAATGLDAQLTDALGTLEDTFLYLGTRIDADIEGVSQTFRYGLADSEAKIQAAKDEFRASFDGADALFPTSAYKTARKELEAEIAAINEAALNIDIKGLEGAELQAALDKVLATAVGQLGEALIPSLKVYQRENEALADTYLRVTSEAVSLRGVLDALGIATANSAAGVVEFTQELIDSLGGFETATSTLDAYTKLTRSSEEIAAGTLVSLDRLTDQIGVASIRSAADLRALVDPILAVGGATSDTQALIVQALPELVRLTDVVFGPAGIVNDASEASEAAASSALRVAQLAEEAAAAARNAEKLAALNEQATGAVVAAAASTGSIMGLVESLARLKFEATAAGGQLDVLSGYRANTLGSNSLGLAVEAVSQMFNNNLLSLQNVQGKEREIAALRKDAYQASTAYLRNTNFRSAVDASNRLQASGLYEGSKPGAINNLGNGKEFEVGRVGPPAPDVFNTGPFAGLINAIARNAATGSVSYDARRSGQDGRKLPTVADLYSKEVAALSARMDSGTISAEQFAAASADLKTVFDNAAKIDTPVQKIRVSLGRVFDQISAGVAAMAGTTAGAITDALEQMRSVTRGLQLGEGTTAQEQAADLASSLGSRFIEAAQKAIDSRVGVTGQDGAGAYIAGVQQGDVGGLQEAYLRLTDALQKQLITEAQFNTLGDKALELFQGVSAAAQEWLQVRDSLVSYRQSLDYGEAAKLTIDQQYIATKSLFEQTSALVDASDIEAAARLQSVAEEFRKASSDLFGSTAGYFNDLDSIKGSVDAAIGIAGFEGDLNQQQTTSLKSIATSNVENGKKIESLTKQVETLTKQLIAVTAAGANQTATKLDGVNSTIEAGNSKGRAYS